MDLKEVIVALDEMHEDSTLPRNVKDKILSLVSDLKNDSVDTAIKVNKALHELEGVADDANMQPYTRTQVWNIISMLEKV